MAADGSIEAQPAPPPASWVPLPYPEVPGCVARLGVFTDSTPDDLSEMSKYFRRLEDVQGLRVEIRGIQALVNYIAAEIGGRADPVTWGRWAQRTNGGTAYFDDKRGKGLWITIKCDGFRLLYGKEIHDTGDVYPKKIDFYSSWPMGKVWVFEKDGEKKARFRLSVPPGAEVPSEDPSSIEVQQKRMKLLWDAQQKIGPDKFWLLKAFDRAITKFSVNDMHPSDDFSAWARKILEETIKDPEVDAPPPPIPDMDDEYDRTPPDYRLVDATPVTRDVYKMQPDSGPSPLKKART